MAIEFDGSSYINVSSWPVPNATTGIVTVSWWWTPTNVAAGLQRLWGSDTHMESRMGENPSLDVVVTNDIFEGDGESDSTTIFANNVLHHIAMTGDANTDTAKVYVDGAWEGTYTGHTGTTVGTALAIGARDSMLDPAIGLMEDWRSYDRELSAAEVATIYAARGVDGIVDGLTARFMFNDREPGHVAVAGDIKDLGPLQLGIASVAGSPTYRESQLRSRRRVS